MTAHVSGAAVPLSIVAAVGETAGATPEGGACPAWLAALLREGADVGAELLLVGDVDAARYAAWARPSGVPTRVIAADAGTLVPRLWGLGLAEARGDAVAFTIDQCGVQPGWARAVLAGLAAGDAGVGGRIDLAPDATATDRAVYYLRYSAFLAPTPGRRAVHDVAGDNAAYRRAALLRHRESYADGFWEVDAHRRMRADGDTLALVPGMAAAFGGGTRLGPMVLQRFAHGTHFGGWRVRVAGQHPLRVLLGAPLVPLVLLLRSVRAALRAGQGPGALARTLGPALPPFLALAAAWAAGEVAGALRPGGRRAPHAAPEPGTRAAGTRATGT